MLAPGRRGFEGICMPRVSVKIEGVEIVVETQGSSSQVPPSEAASPSSTGSFVLLPSSASPASPLSGYLPSLSSEPTRVCGAPRGSEEAPYSGAPQLPSPFPASSALPEYPLLGPEPLVSASQPSDPPAFILQTARALTACNLSPRERIERAWRAGVCAGFVLRGERTHVDATVKLSVPNKFYCVLRTREVSDPLVLRSFAEYKRVPGILEREGSVSHAFPSETEACAYFAGAGAPYPN